MLKTLYFFQKDVKNIIRNSFIKKLITNPFLNYVFFF